MGHTYTSVLFHLVFSTAQRQSSIREPEKLWAYLAGIARNLHIEPLAIGGINDHVHLLVRLPTKLTLAEAVQKLKANSSRWLGAHGEWCGWQEGYGAFSVSASNLESVKTYIRNQAEHHRKRSFEDEFLVLLAKSGISFSAADVFD